MRIFTPNGEVDCAGHSTVDTAGTLVYGERVDQDTRGGWCP
ncbi:MAG: hypothetical protein GKR94_28065 [Gammaproteobacteria bacterium]|nr:hypothetical protein [Gammaproteobacteria bacterium]